MNPRISFTLAAVLLVGAPTVAAQSNLLTNASFESGLSGWTVVTPGAATISYGQPNVPSLAVSDVISGGFQLLESTGGDAVVEQAFAIGPASEGDSLRVRGFLGGVSSSDSARLVIRFLDSGGSEISFVPMPSVTAEVRNFEPVLMVREGTFAIPPGATTGVARIEFDDVCCGGANAAADAIFVEQVDDAAVAPKPLGVELLVNERLEDGWSNGSPLSLADAGGWEGAGGTVLTKAYADADPNTPTAAVSCLIGGGEPTTSCAFGGAGRLLAHAGNARLRQVIDVRGNANLFAAGETALRVAAYLGGVGTSQDTARIDVTLLDASQSVIAPVAGVGPVSAAARNGETTVVRRERNYILNSDVAFVEIAVAFTDPCCGGSFALADNITAQLVPVEASEPTDLNQNLVTNGSFEASTIPGSPLELNNATGWAGVTSGTNYVTNYGGSSSVPDTNFAAESGLGGLLLRHSGTATLTRSFDLQGDQSLIDAGRFRLYASGWFGGSGSSADSAELEISFLSSIGGLVGGAGGFQQLGPVTAADRANQTTLLQRSGDFAVPPNTATVKIELKFTDPCCGGSTGLADGIQLVVYDTLVGGPSKLPGTGEDLRLFSGVNGPPTTGPGEDVEVATALDVLSLRVESPDGTFDFAPLVLAANILPTGAPLPSTGVPGLALDPSQIIVLVSGLGCTGFGCGLVLPGGTQLNVLIPPTFGGSSILLQAYALNGGSTPPANGLFAGSDAHEIQIVGG